MHLHHHENAMAQLRGQYEDFLANYRQRMKDHAYAMAEKICAAQPPLPILPLPPAIVRTISETIASLQQD